MINQFIVLIVTLICIYSCAKQQPNNIKKQPQKQDTFKVFTSKIDSVNPYKNFNAVLAQNTIADIENSYFNNFNRSVSQYYGTVWREQAELDFINDSISVFNSYLNLLNKKADSMHCTIYAMEAIKSGFKTHYDSLMYYHKQYYKNHEHAGWSIAYILTKHYNWKAYLFLEQESIEYERCIKQFKDSKTYYVWKRPNIPLEDLFIINKQEHEILRLLKSNMFGFGFSEQGIHTWITRYDTLKECYWAGSPSNKYSNHADLFLKTPFLDYKDYNSHIIIFPPKQ